MVRNQKSLPPTLPKALTGIEGFDEITGGGLPQGRTTLIEGGPGSGKTIMALQTLVNGARHENEPGIFVAFEESSECIVQNAAKFGWDLVDLQKKKLFFLNAQPTTDMVHSGSFDLAGLLAIVEAKAKEIKAKRIVFDAIDIVLSVLNDPLAEKREAYRLHEWLMAHGFTAIITAKASDYESRGVNLPHLSFLQFMVDCAVTLNHEVIQGISQRNLRVMKYRGSSFSENEAPFLIGNGGIEVAASRSLDRVLAPVTKERVSTGVKRLDTMLGGGYYRGASVLITGFPGTAKTTLAGAFAQAACERGEPTLFVSFDSDPAEIIRNLASVAIRLERFVKNGLLKLVSSRAVSDSAELHRMEIQHLATEHRARCLVIDPLSALSKAGNEETAYSVAGRLIDWTKQEGITMVCTSLLDQAAAQAEGTPMQISTIADTWIHLNYLVQAGERNRGLSIIKSRGTSHSNQVRELVLSRAGVTLADAYTAGGEVLMGTLRWEKELAVRSAQTEAAVAAQQRQVALVTEEAELEARLQTIQAELNAKRDERQILARQAAKRAQDWARRGQLLRERRGKGEV
jgi:circadian clock protein KaiC